MNTQPVYTIGISTKALFRIVLMAFGVFVVWKGWPIIVLVITAMVIAIFIESIARMVMRLRVPRTLAIIGVFAVGVALIGYLFISLIPVFISELVNVGKILPQVEIVQKILNSVELDSQRSLFQLDPATVIKNIQGSVGGLSSGVSGFFSGIFGNIAHTILLLVLSLYLALEERGVERMLRSIVPADSEEYAVRLWIRVRSKVESWFRGQLLIALITAVLTFVGLLIIGVPNALLLGMVAGVFGMVPFGILVATIPAALVAFFHGGVITLIYVGALYWLLQQLLDYFIGPMITRKATGLPSLMIVISFVLMISLVGILGFFLAIPTAILILELVSDYEKSKAEQATIDAIPTDV
jgi:predicted PurR-regulated permease PerM